MYYAPGLIPGTVRDRAGVATVFPTEKDARLAAAEAMIATLNAPRDYRDVRDGGKPERYQKLSGAEFANLLQESGITLKLFAYIYGTSMKRAFWWLDGRNDKGGEENVPHPARILLELFKADPKNIDIAEAVTDSVTEKR